MQGFPAAPPGLMPITQVKEEVRTMLAESSYVLASAVWPGLRCSALCTTDKPTEVCLEVVEAAVPELREVQGAW